MPRSTAQFLYFKSFCEESGVTTTYDKHPFFDCKRESPGFAGVAVEVRRFQKYAYRISARTA